MRRLANASATRPTAVYRFGQDLKEARDAGQMDRAIRLFSSELKHGNLVPDLRSWFFYFRSYEDSRMTGHAVRLIQEFKAFKFPPDKRLYAAMMQVLLLDKQYDKILELQNEILERGMMLDRSLYACIIAALHHSGKPTEAWQNYEEMHQAGLIIDRQCFVTMCRLWCKDEPRLLRLVQDQLSLQLEADELYDRLVRTLGAGRDGISIDPLHLSRVFAEKMPSFDRGRFVQGLLPHWVSRGDLPRAAAAFEALKELHHTPPKAVIENLFLLVACNNQLQPGEALYETLRTLGPLDNEVQEGMISLYLNYNKWKPARDILLHLAESGQSISPEVAKHTLRVLWRFGKVEEARPVIAHLQATYPEQVWRDIEGLLASENMSPLIPNGPPQPGNDLAAATAPTPAAGQQKLVAPAAHH
jgi:hypothetical protein